MPWPHSFASISILLSKEFTLPSERSAEVARLLTIFSPQGNAHVAKVAEATNQGSSKQTMRIVC